MQAAAIRGGPFVQAASPVPWAPLAVVLPSRLTISPSDGIGPGTRHAPRAEGHCWSIRSATPVRGRQSLGSAREAHGSAGPTRRKLIPGKAVVPGRRPKYLFAPTDRGKWKETER